VLSKLESGGLLNPELTLQVRLNRISGSIVSIGSCRVRHHPLMGTVTADVHRRGSVQSRMRDRQFVSPQ
jgi:hypothetical protein